MNNKKLPVIKIIVESMTIALRNKERFSKALALPTLILVVLWAINHFYLRKVLNHSAFPAAPYYILLAIPFAVLGLSIFAVTCHRLILADTKTATFIFPFRIRLLKFSLMFIVVYVIYYLVFSIPMSLLLNTSAGFRHILSPENFWYIKMIFSIPAMYVVGRLSLVFPAAAIDHGLRFRESWILTRQNGWRMAVIIGIYPLIIKTLIGLVGQDHPSAFEWILMTLLYYYTTAMVIFALSLSYDELVLKDKSRPINPEY